MPHTLKLAAIVFTALLNIGAVDPGYWRPHFDARLPNILSLASITGTGDFLIIGDSNIERYWPQAVAGCQLINAGLGGARVHDIAERADAVASTLLPKIVVVMVGTNNLMPGFLELPVGQAEFDAFAADYRAIVVAFKSRGAKVVAMPIAPFASGVADNAKRDALNVVIRDVAIEQGVYWDWWWPNQITAGAAAGGIVASGYAAAGALTDGIHFSAATLASFGDRLVGWKTYIQQQTGVSC